jgi:prepilin-type N-terminal cleavage/methylation domain-containing protein
MQRILRSNSGFTLVEMLAATLVLGLLTSMVAMGVTLGMKAYQRSSFESEAQILASTLDASLSDPLRFSTAQATDNNSFAYQVTYRNNTITNVQLTTHEVPRADGKKVNVLAFESESGQYYDITNAGAYTNCTITKAEMTFTPSESERSTVGPADHVKISFTIESTSDPSLTKDYTVTYVPLNATKEPDTNNAADTNTDEDGTTAAPAVGTAPTTAEASLTDARSGWSNEFTWYKETDTDMKMYYVAAQSNISSG